MQTEEGYNIVEKSYHAKNRLSNNIKIAIMVNHNAFLKEDM